MIQISNAVQRLDTHSELCYTMHDRIGLIVGEEEGEAMKRHWLRGMLLGVSVALLLGGGVALAQSLDVWPDCFVCRPESWVAAQADGPYEYSWESCGWEPGESLKYSETFANGYPGGLLFADADVDGCLGGGPWSKSCKGAPEQDAADVSAGNTWVWPDDFWGPIELCVSPAPQDQVSADQIVCDTILFAEVCGVQEEFVPEPGSILLLGSGLMGLAGYAGLRWRTRE